MNPMETNWLRPPSVQNEVNSKKTKQVIDDWITKQPKGFGMWVETRWLARIPR